jgi:hypothetical protein
MGITRECWFLQRTPQGDLLLLYLESYDLAHVVRVLARSRDPFDRWLRAWLAEVSGTDLGPFLGQPASEQLSSYEASSTHVPV